MTAALEAVGICKAYGGAHALDGVGLTLRGGEVHALIGQNGSGKSTLVKTLSGVVTPDAGVLRIHGDPVRLPLSDPYAHGIAVVHQDLGLVDRMSVAENLGITTRYGTPAFAPIGLSRRMREYRTFLDDLGVAIDVRVEVGRLAPAERSLVAIARAVHQLRRTRGQGVFILDEPTATLSSAEADFVLALMRRIAATGSSVLFISHRLGEVIRSCDRTTVLRDGRVVAESDIAGITRHDLVEHMLGRRVGDYFPAKPLVEPGAVVLAAENLSGRSTRNVSLVVRSGEVVGLTGLSGMGHDALLRLLACAERPESGRVWMAGEPPGACARTDPRAAIGAGVVLVPGNRLRDGVWPAGSAEENISLPALAAGRRRLTLSARQLWSSAQRWMTELLVSPSRPELPLSAFSGGNQQKIVLGKWLQLSPRVLLVDEPGQGVDPGAASEILRRLLDVAEAGGAVVVASGDHEQLVAICDRVLVFGHGRVLEELDRAYLSERSLSHACQRASLDAEAVA